MHRTWMPLLVVGIFATTSRAVTDQDQSPPVAESGQRLEAVEAGHALTFPDDWIVFEPTGGFIDRLLDSAGGTLCRASDPPADAWRSIAETLQFLPAEEARAMAGPATAGTAPSKTSASGPLRSPAPNRANSAGLSAGHGGVLSRGVALGTERDRMAVDGGRRLTVAAMVSTREPSGP
jgi:hypothetical protein